MTSPSLRIGTSVTCTMVGVPSRRWTMKIPVQRRPVRSSITDERSDRRSEPVDPRVERDERVAHLEVRLEAPRTEIIKWMFVFWSGTVLALAGFLFTYLKASK